MSTGPGAALADTLALARSCVATGDDAAATRA
jgi:hypothetical protein